MTYYKVIDEIAERYNKSLSHLYSDNPKIEVKLMNRLTLETVPPINYEITEDKIQRALIA